MQVAADPSRLFGDRAALLKKETRKIDRIVDAVAAWSLPVSLFALILSAAFFEWGWSEAGAWAAWPVAGGACIFFVWLGARCLNSTGGVVAEVFTSESWSYWIGGELRYSVRWEDVQEVSMWTADLTPNRIRIRWGRGFLDGASVPEWMDGSVVRKRLLFHLPAMAIQERERLLSASDAEIELLEAVDYYPRPKYRSFRD